MRSAARSRSWCRVCSVVGVGDTVGAQVGAAVVGLITNPFIGNGLVSLVDAIAGGLFGSQDVVDAWAVAAGRLWQRWWVICRRCCRGDR